MANFQLGHVLFAFSMAVLSQADSFIQSNAGDNGPSLLLSLMSATCGVLALTPEQEQSKQPHRMHHEVNPALTKVLTKGHPTHFAMVFEG